MAADVPPVMGAEEVDILGHMARISIIPYHIKPNPFDRQGNWYIIRFYDKIVETGPSFLIVEYKENQTGNFEWIIVPQSPILNRPDLLEASAKVIDDYYDSFD